MNEAPSRFEPGPVQPAERVHALDMIRGFALLGVLIANINTGLVYPLAGFRRDFAHGQAGADYILEWLLWILVHNKFYMMFSLLFGAGFVIFLERARARGVRAEFLFARRLGALLLIGLAHGLLVWWADTLTTYAVFGMFLLAFTNVPARRLWKWGVAIFLLPTALLWISALLGPDPAVTETAAVREARLARIDAEVLIYSTGTWWEVARLRLEDFFYMGRNASSAYGPQVLGMFLIGAAIVRGRLHVSLDNIRPQLRLVAFAGLAVGLPAAAYGTAGSAFNHDIALWATASRLGGIMLCLAYVAAFALFMQRARWLASLAPVGRMALTNYLTQSLVFTWVFCGYGLGIGDSLGRVTTTSMALIFFGLQAWFSSWWLARYRYGPMEWAWRTMTYGKLQPLRALQQPA